MIDVLIVIDELKKIYNVIVFCIGATGSKKLDIPGENLKNVYTSHKFVNWYNGLPDVPIIENDLLKNNYDSINSIKNVSIFGSSSLHPTFDIVLFKIEV